MDETKLQQVEAQVLQEWKKEVDEARVTAFVTFPQYQPAAFRTDKYYTIMFRMYGWADYGVLFGSRLQVRA